MPKPPLIFKAAAHAEEWERSTRVATERQFRNLIKRLAKELREAEALIHDLSTRLDEQSREAAREAEKRRKLDMARQDYICKMTRFAAPTPRQQRDELLYRKRAEQAEQTLDELTEVVVRQKKLIEALFSRIENPPLVPPLAGD